MALRAGRQGLTLWAIGILVFIITASFTYHSYIGTFNSAAAFSWDSLNANGNASTYSPVLGDREDPSRLYFPPNAAKQFPVAEYNKAPVPRPRTPIFIGFTQNNGMLKQTVLGYIAAGWPPEDIIVVDNSGTMDANSRGELSKQNTFYLDYRWIRSVGVAILQTPTLLTFAQLQNFYLRTAIAQNWPYFFWSHMDVIVLGDEDDESFRPFYRTVLDVVAQVSGKTDWALKWFSYDALTMVNPENWRKVGQWDPFIPYYQADCDAYSRMVLSGFNRQAADVHAGTIFDLAEVIDDVETLVFPTSASEKPNSTRYQLLRNKLQELDQAKKNNKDGRNTWQGSQGSPDTNDEMWTYDPKGFRYSWWKLAEKGREIYRNKWGTGECNLDEHGSTIKDMWRNVQHQ